MTNEQFAYQHLELVKRIANARRKIRLREREIREVEAELDRVHDKWDALIARNKRKSLPAKAARKKRSR